uniref:Uncharacterized protein n=1 Tax=Caenorhabditis japonica TaxID=281687 RepID=A0A8R1E0S9_CAEJA
MDPAQLFCAFLISAMLSLFLKSIIFPEKKKKTVIIEDRRKSLISSSQRPETPKSHVARPEMHDVQELKHLTIVELQNFNAQFSRFTDRYWREIFRRQNDAHHPDHINVSRLQTPNIITALDEYLPHGPIKEVTIIGLIPKPFSSRKCEVMRYLKDRLSTSPDAELSFSEDRLRITSDKA